MRFAGNFNPEWGFLAPAPGFARMARIAVVAAAVGASAGAAVVFSLVERPAAEETSVAARTLAQPTDPDSGISTAAAQSALTPQAQIQAAIPPARGGKPEMRLLANGHVAGQAVRESGASSTDQGLASIAGLAESPAAADAAPAAASNETAAAPEGALKKAVKKQRLTWRNGQQTNSSGKGPLALLRSFGGFPVTGTYQARGEY